MLLSTERRSGKWCSEWHEQRSRDAGLGDVTAAVEPRASNFSNNRKLKRGPAADSQAFHHSGLTRATRVVPSDFSVGSSALVRLARETKAALMTIEYIDIGIITLLAHRVGSSDLPK